MKPILGVLCSLLFLSCSFDYEEVQLAENLDSEIADIEMFDTTIHFVRGTTLRIHLSEVRIFSQKDVYNLYDLEFQELDKKKEVRMEGSADKASIRTDNNDVTLEGNIQVRSNTDNVDLQTNFIQWKDKEKIIQGSESDLLSLKRDDGSKIEGYGFEGDAESRSFTLHSGILGELVVEESDSAGAESVGADSAGPDSTNTDSTNTDSTNTDSSEEENAVS